MLDSLTINGTCLLLTEQRKQNLKQQQQPRASTAKSNGSSFPHKPEVGITEAERRELEEGLAGLNARTGGASPEDGRGEDDDDQYSSDDYDEDDEMGE